jgi:hypothetical protein
MEPYMFRTTLLLLAVIVGLPSSAFAGKGGGGGGQSASTHASTGTSTTPQATKPQLNNIMKTKHDTVKNTISNVH